MALKFKCKHCGEELIVYYLKIGEQAQCKSCKKTTIVANTAEFLDIPFNPPTIKEIESIYEQRERTREEILRSPSVKIVKGVLDIIWYVGIIIISLTITLQIFFGPNSGVFNATVVELPIGIRYYDGIENNSGESQNLNDEIVLIGHDFGFYRIPTNSWPSSAFIDFILSCFFVMGAVYFLRRIFKSILRGTPFIKENSKYLRYVGCLIAMWGPVYGTFNFLQGAYYLPFVRLANAEVGVELNWYPKLIIVGMVIIVIAHLFELASRIQRENELTI